MGQKAIEITGLDVNDLIYKLNRAYADEWFAVFSYLHMARTVSGKGYEDMEEFLKKIATDEFEHAGELAARITELGGQPVKDIQQLRDFATAPYPMPPDNTWDYEAIINVVLGAESGAIHYYNELAGMTLGKDHVTYQLVVHLLSEEVAHEEMFQNLRK